MAVNEARQNHPARVVGDQGLRPLMGHHVLERADRDDPPAASGDGFGRGLRVRERHDVADQNQIGRTCRLGRFLGR
jgi:hypothetical protein